MNLEQFLTDRRYLFWTLQIGGWGGWGITWYASNVYYGGVPDNYAIYIFIISGLGLAISLAMRAIYQANWESHPAKRAATVLATSWTAAAIWVGLRHWIFEDFMSFPQKSKSGMESHNSDSIFALMEGITIHWFVMLSWSGLYVGIKYYQLLQDERQRGIRIESMAHEAQLKMLRYQLNPHFLFNTLNAIATLVLEQRNEIANTMLNRLSNFLRYSLDNNPMQKICLNQEIEALNLYLEIEKVRFEERLRVNYEITSGCGEALIPSLLLQPLVENAIKYAVSAGIDGGSIHVGAYRFGSELLLEVTDDGPGMPFDGSAEIKGSGVGMINTRERLQALYGEQQSLVLSSNEPHGLKISIRIPFQTSTEV